MRRHRLAAVAGTACLTAAALLPSVPGTRVVPPAFVIRVDQVGYPLGAAKVALVMSTGRLSGAQAEVVTSSGLVAWAGSLGSDRGRWSDRYPAVYPVVFSSLRRPGTYRVEVQVTDGGIGEVGLSAPFAVAPASSLYAAPLERALSFYETEQDGPHFVRSALRSAPGDLNDEHAMTYRTPPMNGNGNFRGSLAPYALARTIDAAGGWFDAGDYLKFVETTSYVVDLLAQGVVSFPRSMASRHGADFTGEVAVGLGFLRQMWDESTRTLYYQVGIGEGNSYYLGDHDIWRLPQADDTYGGTNPHDEYIRHPPVFRAGAPGSEISPNLAGRIAAAFALGYRIFRSSRPAYADSLLASARTVFSLAGTTWKRQLLTTAPYDFYPETSYHDDLALGAVELSLALRDEAVHTTGSSSASATAAAGSYLVEAGRFLDDYEHDGEAGSDTLNLYDVSALADFEIARALRVEPVPAAMPVTAAQATRWLGDEIGLGLAQARKDPFGFGFAWDQWDTAAHGAGLSVMANEYDALAGRPVYASQAQGWLDNILGANAWGVSFVVGDGTSFPDCLQHQIANLAGSLTGGSPILDGATVEGPNSYAATGLVAGMRRCPVTGGNRYAAFDGHGAVYADNVQSYSTNEPAIDLTVLTPFAFAWQEEGSSLPSP